MEGIAVEYFTNSIDTGSNKKSKFHSYISDDKKNACDSHSHIFHLLNKLFESGILVSDMSTV